MTLATISKVIKSGKPAVIKEHGSPRYVVLDWRAYKKLVSSAEDLEDSARLLEALHDPKNRKRIKFLSLK